jgi:choice-of-anchor B domain-containing protein
MKIIFNTFIFLMLCIFNTNAQFNLSRIGAWYSNGQSLAGCWHYVDSSGHEYALVGASQGIMILDISNPAVPVFLFQLPGLSSIWHEVKVSGNYAYAVSEAQDTDTLKDGLQIINLSYLPDSAPNYFWHTDDIMTDKLRQAHSITVDDNYIYVNGHSVPGHGNGVLILDKSDPWNPVYKGVESLRYCHDSYVRGDTLWTSDIQDGMFSVFNISDRANPTLLATQQTPLLFNHNAWLNDDGRYLFTTDERQGAPIGSFDVSDLSNITLVDAYYTTNMLPNESHNVRVLNDFIINASYGSQVTIVDAAHPDNLIEVGNYPTGTGLCWDADPFLPSGIIIATDMQMDSVYFLQPNYVRACYLTGTVTDSVTGNTLNDVKVDITSIALHDSTNLTGMYKTGYATAGAYNVEFSKPGYFPKVYSVQLNNGVETVLDVQLVDTSFDGIVEMQVSDWIDIENNPSSNEIKLVLSPKFFESSSKVSLTVSDVMGRNVYEKKDIEEKSIILRKSEIGAGNYFYSIGNEKGFTAKGKLIFQ